MPDLIRKQLIPVIGGSTTSVCLDAAGQVHDVAEPYDTAAGQFDFPPFHRGCRSISAPWLPGFPTAAADARAEAAARPDTADDIPPAPAGQPAAAGVAARRSAARAAAGRRTGSRRRVS